MPKNKTKALSGTSQATALTSLAFAMMLSLEDKKTSAFLSIQRFLSFNDWGKDFIAFGVNSKTINFLSVVKREISLKDEPHDFEFQEVDIESSHPYLRNSTLRAKASCLNSKSKEISVLFDVVDIYQFDRLTLYSNEHKADKEVMNFKILRPFESRRFKGSSLMIELKSKFHPQNWGFKISKIKCFY